MMQSMVVGLVLVSALYAQSDVTGRWSGTIEATGNLPQPLYARFQRDGKGLTGSIGSDTTKLTPIANVKLDGDLLTFDVTWGDGFHIALTRQGNELKGELHGDGPSPPGKHPATITILLKRVAPSG
jgi:hypothetical protein